MEELWTSEQEENLIELGERLSERYRSAEPFPHAVIDDFLPVETAESAWAAFPDRRGLAWEKFSGENEEKMAFFAAERLAKPLRQTLHFLNAAPVLRFLEALTGIEGLLPDPYFFGGGLHRIERGGFLEIHADFNRLPKLNLYRRINLLIYLNKNWDDAHGGSLELWNEDMSHCVHRVAPIFNRCVIFNTTSTSYHGNPQPVAGPEGNHRQSLAAYYYTALDPETTARPAHSTLFQQRPGAHGEPRVAPTAPAASGPGGLHRAIRRWFRRS